MKDWTTLQRKLGVKADNQIGPVTLTALFRKMGAAPSRAAELGAAAATLFPTYGILNSDLNLAHFMAQTAHESGGFTYMKEIWGPTPAQLRYEGRADLGNTQPGDGKRYMGRGVIQITGRVNYRKYGGLLGLPLETQPDLAAQPATGLHIACEYWKRNGLNGRAGNDDLLGITRAINGGANGYDDRKAMLAKMKGLVG